MKRFFDIAISGLAILILSPLLIPVMIALKLTGEHYIFYRQKRIGRGGREFYMLKFATMLLNSPNLQGGLYTTKDDPRLLPLGKLLRKTKINELPQLVNIFIGQMSFVGYRPTVREHFEGYPDHAKKKLAEARPGLTGIGSLVFRNEEEILHEIEDKKAFHQNIIAPYKAELECWYCDHDSIFNYFKLIFATAIAVIRPGAIDWEEWFEGLPPVPEALRKHLK